MLLDLGALDGGALCYGSAGAGPLDSGLRPHPLDLRMPLRRGELRSWFLTRCQERSQPRKNRGGGLGCFGRFCFGASCKGPPNKNGRVQKSKRELNFTIGVSGVPDFLKVPRLSEGPENTSAGGGGWLCLRCCACWCVRSLGRCYALLCYCVEAQFIERTHNSQAT